jgi:NTE family protein
MLTSTRPALGLALGSGSARGWSHIGVISALAELGIKPDIICGTSIGALVGAASATGNLEKLENWVCGLTLQNIVGYLDVTLESGGVIKGDRLMDFFRRNFQDQAIEQLPTPFGAVATDLETGREVWLREGPVLAAVHASLALPGLFSPIRKGGRWLVDGGLVNPVPVSLCRAMGADIVIAVDLNADIVGKHLQKHQKPGVPPLAVASADQSSIAETIRLRLRETMNALNIPRSENTQKAPSMFDVVASSINIMQTRITRSRLAGEPPDVLITPRLAHLGLMEFHRAPIAIEEGRRAVQDMAAVLRSYGLSEEH